MRRLILLPFLCLIATSVNAQVAPGQIYFEDPTPPVVMRGSIVQKYPWAGGLNNPQFAMADLNKDGVKDMVIFEPGNGVKTFLNTSTSIGNPNYVYSPGYAALFPDIIDYMKLEDYNGDNIPDLFHRGMPGVSVYTGYYNSQNQLSFKKFKDLYYFLPGSGMVNVYVSPIDIPAIVDVDKDGDLDVISYDIWGGQVTYYRNCRVEDGLPKDSMRMCLKDMCWGRFSQSYERKLGLAFNCSQYGVTCAKTTKTTHSGNTLCLLDYDGDGDYDMFNGNVSYPDIQLGINGKVGSGKLTDSIVSQDTLWSSHGKALYMPMMPTAFWLDVDNDNDKDLLFSPRNENTENRKCVAFYKNVGSDASPDFVYQSDSFMVDNMIDVGLNTNPVFYDYNKDGKADLFIGCEGRYEPGSGNMRTSISYYENQSTLTASKFVLITTDFLGLHAGNTKGSTMAMGDLDGDGIDDLVIGKLDGTMLYYRNTATSNTVQPVWQYTSILNDLSGQIDVGDYPTPIIYDINKDGKNDILSGNQLGRLYYFRNVGSSGGYPLFNMITDTLGGIQIVQEGNLYTYSAPIIAKCDNTKLEYLLLGTKNGTIYRYDSFRNGNVTKPYVRLDSNYSLINTVNRSAPAIADINGDGRFDMVIGNALGGVYFYREFYNVGIDETGGIDNRVVVFPNPATTTVNVSWKNSFIQDNIQVSLMSATGMKIWTGVYDSKTSNADINVSSLATGTYFCIVQSGTNHSVAPISIVR